MNIDLNINNYDLPEILSLFNLSEDFDSTGLKRAYKQVLMTHPDKSGLDKEYFLFFSKAFKLLKSIYDYTHKKETCAKEIVYNNKFMVDDSIKNFVDKQRKKTMKEGNTTKGVRDFNKKFNALFEKVKFEDEEQDTGYGEWFSNSDNSEHEHISNVRDMNSYIDAMKEKQRAIIVHKGLHDVGYSDGGYNLTRDKPEEYTSDIFSKLPYEDLKKAHTETVIPVTHEDFENHKQFANVTELNMYRKQNESVLDEETTQQLYLNHKKKEEQENIQNAYKMMKQMEQIERSHKLWNANFRLLTNHNE